ncbi:MAG: RagB/SusD family nutrient uptake outer membrane protein [Bacteroides sp.]|nr:RagB/SusD family nutrient uptake outer membrane protein [Bacteroides sp.]
MKNITKWSIAALFGLSVCTVSCVDPIKFGDSFLEKAPSSGELNQDSIFGKADYARAFLWDAYNKLYFGLPFYWDSWNSKMNTGMFETLSDCWHSHNSWDGVNRYYYSGSYNAAIEDNTSQTRYHYLKDRNWNAIRQSWIFIENVSRVPDMEESEKARLIAEAKVLIASRYFDLFRHYGGLPLVENSYGVETSYEIPRATAAETVEYIIKLLDEAASESNLPWDLGTDDTNWQGRFTKASAMGLKCKVLLFAASPLFNDASAYCSEEPQDAITNLQAWYGGYDVEWWNRCLTACEAFFSALNTNGYYQLMQASGTTCSAYRTAFNNAYFTRQNNTELLISTRVSGKYGSWWYQWTTFASYGGYTPTLEYMEMFPMSDGTPFSEDLLVDGGDPFFTDNDYNKPIRDPRLYETMLVNGAAYGDHSAELWIGGRENISSTSTETGATATGFRLYKFYKEGSLSNTYPQWPYLRLAEMYLIYAEALLKANRLSDAIKQVDIVRARVGLPGLVESNPSKNLTTNSDALLEEILRERACELGLEDVRLFDMIRYKRADLFQKQLHGLKIYRNDGGGDNPWSGTSGNSSEFPNKPSDFKYEIFTLSNIARSWWTNFSPKWYLAAFPPSEVNKGYGLTQNPGW